jgi:hypothetical protein
MSYEELAPSQQARYRSVPRKETKGRVRSRAAADFPLPCVSIQDHSSVNGIPEVFAKALGRQPRALGGLGEQGHVIIGGVWVARRPTAGSTSFFFIFTSRPTSSHPPTTADAARQGSTSLPPRSHLSWKIPSPVPTSRCRQPHRPPGAGAAAASPPHPKSRWTVLSRARGRPAVGQLTEQPIDSALLRSDRCAAVVAGAMMPSLARAVDEGGLGEIQADATRRIARRTSGRRGREEQ